MEDNEKTMAFVQWIAQQMGIEPEQAIEQIQQVMQTEDGQKQIGELYQQFEQQTSRNQMFRKGGKIDQLVNRKNIIKAQGGVSVPIKDYNWLARWAAQWNAEKYPAPGVTNRKVGFALDKNGGQHYYENAVINGNSADTEIYIPHPGDTLVTQSVATRYGQDNRSYPMGTEQYESVMNRNRKDPAWGLMDYVRKNILNKK